MAGVIRQQPQDRFGHFFRGAAPPHGDHGLQPFHPVGGTGCGMNVGIDQARCDGPSALKLALLEPFLQQVKAIDEVVKALPVLDTR